ncbi:hypothetical protein HPB48_002398 [Haemaphysalis longicornis]|uniref:Uncharacterized protein n=1 Tax=Haemaphysalis longicornis TaxID=44386 RepID=A0A9J6GAX6_HAELO|nr:hypothetical protein HPB48_002398 [Haemaphysalis longicornis]
MPAEEEADEGQAPPENHSQTSRRLYPRAMEVEGEPLSPDDTVGWLESYKKLRRRELEKLNQPLDNTTAGRHGRGYGINNPEQQLGQLTKQKTNATASAPAARGP